MLRFLAPDVWVADYPLKLLGALAGTRMTVLRLESGKLVLISPVELTDALAREVGALGDVSWVVGPNAYHHLYLGQWKQAFPAAKLVGSSSLVTKRADLAFELVLGRDEIPEWTGQLESIPIAGMPKVQEVVFWHPRSGTLVVTDLFFNVTAPADGWTRFLFWSMGALGGPRQSRFLRFLVKDSAALAESIRALLALPMQRIVLTHGEICEHSPHDALREASAWAGVT